MLFLIFTPNLFLITLGNLSIITYYSFSYKIIDKESNNFSA
jgi:hypothetical protein